MLLIGLTSYGSQVGKSTIASYLRSDKNFAWMKLSSPFKEMLEVLFRRLGFAGSDIIRMIDGDLKHTAMKCLGGKRPVDLMISLGNSWGRDMVDERVWLECARLDLIELDVMAKKRSSESRIVFDDIRQPNEVEWLRAHNGILIRIARPTSKHFAIDGLLSGVAADHEINNDSDILTLCRKVDELLQRLTGDHHE